MSAPSPSWQFWIDRGGTFTDVVARRPDGAHLTHKLLSDNPEQYPDAALAGIRNLMGLARDAAIPAEQIEAVKMGTTVATNALLERKGEATLLVTTRGFRDALRIGYQNRPRLFDLHIQLPEMLYQQVIEIDERVSAQGDIVQPLDEATARTRLEHAFASGIRSCAIVFMHGYRYPEHERRVAALARAIGYTQVSTSHGTSPLMKLVSRGDTTVVDAYLSPILRRYVDQIAAELGDTRLLFMQSNGGLTDARLFQGKDAILSGPAGGVVGAVQTAAMAGFEQIIGFDMGGTSTDVCHYAGELERAFETEVAGVRMRAPMMHIHTVAAGGGSILHFDGARYRVGPDSAGANPGPACYRRGGPLTVTDCNVMLGKLQPDHFPAVFGPQGDQVLDVAIVRERFAALAERIQDATGQAQTPEAVAEGFLRIAVDNMANAIKKISIQRGYDVSRYTLCCFGGAGGQHACAVADALGIKTLFIHPYAGVLSAYGMGLADLRALREASVELPLDAEAETLLRQQLDALEATARTEIRQQGIPEAHIDSLRKVHLRYQGTDSTLEVDYADRARMIAAFEAAHRQRFGFVYDNRALIAATVAVEAIGRTESLNERAEAVANPGPATALSPVRIHHHGEQQTVPLYPRTALEAGQRVDGPALIIEATATTVVEADWQAEVLSGGQLVVRRVKALPSRVAIGTQVDPVMLEIFNNLFMSVAEQMGVTLQNTAASVNIKERLDFSCAVFDPSGHLIANAPHMPVHLGSMGESVRSILRQHSSSLKPGDVFALNAPYNGGTHLPDITVITPVFAEDGQGEVLFLVASRGHHADVGGITPGSMPAFSRSVDEEGVLFSGERIVRDDRFLEQETRAILTGGAYPARNPEQNIGDLLAQIAANERGVRELRRMISLFGLEVVQAYMRHVQDNAEESVRRVIDRLQSGHYRYEMDHGAAIEVSIQVDKTERSATVDFTGTSAQQPNNFNAPSAVARAAVLYVFRTLVDDAIPLNEGCLKPLKVHLPEGCMLNPQYPAAVVAGNVETSQAIVDTLYGALGVMAAAQGTMNNFTFGNAEHQYYETLCGGSGAGPDFDGTSAVHTHMTNSRLTDPEVLEWRFPVRLEAFAIREGSGGTGRQRGGDGVIRRVRFLETMTASILSGHRRIPPFGLQGGEPGALGRNTVERADGRVETLHGCDQTEMQPGDVLVIETPGGGGMGQPADLTATPDRR